MAILLFLAMCEYDGADVAFEFRAIICEFSLSSAMVGRLPPPLTLMEERAVSELEESELFKERNPCSLPYPQCPGTAAVSPGLAHRLVDELAVEDELAAEDDEDEDEKESDEVDTGCNARAMFTSIFKS